MLEQQLEQKLEWAQEQMDIGNWGRVQKVAEQVLQSPFDHLKPLALKLRGLSYLNERQMQEALADFNQVLELDGDNPEVLLLRSHTRFQLQDFAGAAEDVRFLHEKEPDNPEYIEHRINVEEALGNYPKLIELCNQVLEEDPENATILSLRASAKLATKVYEDAIADLQKLVDMGYSADDTIFTYLGVAHHRLEKPDQAQIYYEQAVAINPYNISAHNNLALLLHQQQDNEAALKRVEIALKINPEYSVAYKNRALIFLALEDKEQALEDLLTAKSLEYHLHYDGQVDELLTTHFPDQDLEE